MFNAQFSIFNYKYLYC